MMSNIIAGKNRPVLSAAEKKFLRDALHTEGSLSGDYETAVRVRKKLGLGPLACEDDS